MESLEKEIQTVEKANIELEIALSKEITEKQAEMAKKQEEFKKKQEDMDKRKKELAIKK